MFHSFFPVFFKAMGGLTLQTDEQILKRVFLQENITAEYNDISCEIELKGGEFPKFSWEQIAEI